MYRLLEQNLRTIPNLQGQPNYVVHSFLKEFHAKFSTDKFAVKYVVEGTEHYTMNAHKISLQAGQYLLSNGHKEGSVEIDSKATVQGICFYIQPELLSEVSASIQLPYSAVPDMNIDRFFKDAAFLTNTHYANQTKLGGFLKKFSRQINKSSEEPDLHLEELYYTLCEMIIFDYRKYNKQLQSIPSVKAITKKDLLKKIIFAKAYMDNHFTCNPTIATIAKVAQMSEYHFFRLFKAVHGVSPKQYLNTKRLKLANALLLKQNHSVTEAGLEAGFTDIYSFSRIYKKYFGKTPSAILGSKKQDFTNYF